MGLCWGEGLEHHYANKARDMTNQPVGLMPGLHCHRLPWLFEDGLFLSVVRECPGVRTCRDLGREHQRGVIQS